MVLKQFRIKHAAILFFALLALLPAIVLLAGLLGCRVTQFHEPVGLCLSTAALLILTIFAGEPAKADRVCAALLPFLAIINFLFRLFPNRWLPFLLFMAVDSVCAWIMFARFAGPKTLKTVFGILPASLYVVLLYLSPAILIGSIGENTVLQSIPSPDGKQVAQVIDSDQGALGGGSIIEVIYRSADLFLLRIEDTQQVYFGKWGESFDMEVSWRDDDTLLINGRPYDVP